MILCYSLPNGQNEKVRSALFLLPRGPGRRWNPVTCKCGSGDKTCTLSGEPTFSVFNLSFHMEWPNGVTVHHERRMGKKSVPFAKFIPRPDVRLQFLSHQVRALACGIPIRTSPSTNQPAVQTHFGPSLICSNLHPPVSSNL